jgi:hypothetical protein
MIPIISPLKTPAFNPLMPGSCAVALNAGTNVTFNGDNVSAVGDYSGNGWNCSQGTPDAQPGYDATGFNGYPIIKTARPGYQCWLTSGTKNIGVLTGFTIILVANLWDGVYWLSFKYDTFSIDGYGDHTRVTTAACLDSYTLPTDAGHIVIVTYDGTVAEEHDRLRLYYDGVKFDNPGTNFPLTTADFGTDAVYDIGRWVSGGWYGTINIADFLFFTKCLSAEEMAYENRGFGAKYGISVS